MANENQDNYAAKASSPTPSSADGAALGSTTAEFSDLYLATESVVYFGDAQDVLLTHNDEVGLTLSGTGTAVFEAGSLTDGTATLTGGALSGVTTISSSGNLTVDTDTLFVDASGNKVGIGTTAPFVLGSGKVALTMADGGAITWKYGANAASRAWGMRPDMEAHGDFCIITADAQDEALDTYRLYINPAGLIGIGTTNPSALLHTVDGAVKFEHSSSNLLVDFEANDSAILKFTHNGAGESTILRTNRYFRFDTGDGVSNVLILNASGNVGIGTATFNGTAEGYLALANGTAPAAATADQVYIGSKDASTSSEATLSLFLEEDPAADADIMQAGDAATHKLKVWINGVEYYIALQAV